MLGWFYGHAVSSKEKSRHKRSLRVKLGATDGKCYLTGGEGGLEQGPGRMLRVHMGGEERLGH